MSQEFTNVWDAIERDQVQAANLKLRTRLMMEVSDYVKQSGLTQAEAAKRLGTTQPRLNDVLKGKIEKCTVDRRHCQQGIDNRRRFTSALGCRAHEPPFQRHIEIQRQNPSLKANQQILFEPVLKRILAPAIRQFGDPFLNLPQAQDTDKQSALINIRDPRHHTGIGLRLTQF